MRRYRKRLAPSCPSFGSTFVLDFFDRHRRNYFDFVDNYSLGSTFNGNQWIGRKIIWNHQLNFYSILLFNFSSIFFQKKKIRIKIQKNKRSFFFIQFFHFLLFHYIIWNIPMRKWSMAFEKEMRAIRAFRVEKKRSQI